MASDTFDSSNAGKRWSKSEINQLVQELESKTSLEDISKIHKRNIGGIESRIAQLASEYIDSGVSIVDVSRKFNIDVLELEKKIKQLRRKDKPTKNDDIQSLLVDVVAEISEIKDKLSELTEIKDILQKLVKKLESVDFE